MQIDEILKCEPNIHSFRLVCSDGKVDSIEKGLHGPLWVDGEKETYHSAVNPIELLLLLTEIHGHDFEGVIPNVIHIEYDFQHGTKITAKVTEGEDDRIHYVETLHTDEAIEAIEPIDEKSYTLDDPYEFKEDDLQPGGDMTMMPSTEIWDRRRLVMHAKTVLGLSERATVKWLEDEHSIKTSKTVVHKDRVAVQQYWANEAVEDFKRHQAIFLGKIDAREREATSQYAGCISEIERLESLYLEIQAAEDYQNKHNDLSSLRASIIKVKDQAIKWFAMGGKEMDRAGKAIGVEPRSKVAMQMVNKGSDSGWKLEMDI